MFGKCYCRYEGWSFDMASFKADRFMINNIMPSFFCFSTSLSRTFMSITINDV
jgi:hypothetical protein